MLDLFPYTVDTADGGHHDRARILFAAGQALVFTHTGEHAELVAEAVVTLAPDGRRMVERIETEGGTWTVRHERDCGCGHPLKRMSQRLLLSVAGR